VVKLGYRNDAEMTKKFYDIAPLWVPLRESIMMKHWVRYATSNLR